MVVIVWGYLSWDMKWNYPQIAMLPKRDCSVLLEKSLQKDEEHDRSFKEWMEEDVIEVVPEMMN